MPTRILSFTSSLLEKTQDFRYFGLIFSFCLMLDSALSYHLGSSLMHFKLSDFGEKVSIGSFLLFLVSFSFLLAFIIPVIKQFLTLVFLVIPWEIRGFFLKKHDPTEKDHYLSYSEIESFAIKEDNKVAYQIYLNEIKSEENYNNLCYFCLTLLVAVPINLVVTYNSEHTIGNYIQTLINADPSFLVVIQWLFFSILFMYCVYLGVIVYCGLSSTDRRKIFIYNHGLNKKT